MQTRLWWMLGGLGLAGCSGHTGEEPPSCQRRAPGEAKVVLHWGEQGASVNIFGITAGAACDQFIMGSLEGAAELAGQSLVDAAFLMHREGSGELGWLKAWPLAEVNFSEVAAAPGGGVWVAGQAGVPTDFGDGVLHPTTNGARVLARYEADGRLAALVVAEAENATLLASNVAAHRTLQLVTERDGETRLHVLDDAATPLLRLTLPPSGFPTVAAPAADGSVFAVTGGRGQGALVERYAASGDLLWSKTSTGAQARSLAVTPSGELVLSGIYCSTADPPPPNPCNIGAFMKLFEANGDTRFEGLKDLWPYATARVNERGTLLVTGDDLTERRHALQLVEADGSWGRRYFFAGPNQSFASAVSDRTLWVAGSLFAAGELAGETLTPLGASDGFIVEVGF